MDETRDVARRRRGRRGQRRRRRAARRRCGCDDERRRRTRADAARRLIVGLVGAAGALACVCARAATAGRRHSRVEEARVDERLEHVRVAQREVRERRLLGGGGERPRVGREEVAARRGLQAAVARTLVESCANR